MQEVKCLNKKRFLIPVSLVIMAAMLILPIVAAATISSVSVSQNVTNPNNIIGGQNDTYAVFQAGAQGAQLVGAAQIAKNALIELRAFINTGSAVTVQVYVGPSSTGPWDWVGTFSVNGGPNYYSAGYAPSAGSYIGIFTNGANTCNIDCIRTTP